MTYTPTTWNAGGAPGISAEELQKLGAQYDAVLQELKDNTGELWGAIKGADGVGSGLDADKLQGNGPSAFLGVNAKAADSNLLDGHDTSYFATGSDLSNHIADKSNPHNVTAEQAKAVSLSGDSMTGPLSIDFDGIGLFLKATAGGTAPLVQFHNPDSTDPNTTVGTRDGSYFVVEDGAGNDLFSIEQGTKDLLSSGNRMFENRGGDGGQDLSTQLVKMGSYHIADYTSLVGARVDAYDWGLLQVLEAGGGTTQIYWPDTDGADGGPYFRTDFNGDHAWKDWKKIWTDHNDGSGSGLDSDMVDGVHASSFARNTGDTLKGRYYTTEGLAVGQTDFSTKYASIDGANDIVVNGMFEQDGPGGSAMYNLGLGGAPPPNEGELQVHGNSILFAGASPGNYNQLWYDEATNVFHFNADDSYKDTSPGSPTSIINVGKIRLSSASKGSGAPSGGEYGELYFQY